VSDYETTQRRRNMIVGVFVVLGLCALVWLVFKFGDLPIAVTKIGSFNVSIQFPTAPGVQRDTPVRFCGYQIGRVTNVNPPKAMRDLNTGKFYHQTIVVISIDKRYSDIPDDVEAKLMTRGLGSSYIELKLSSYDVNEPTGTFLSHGSKLQGSTGITSEFFPEESQEKLQELVEGLRILVGNANDIVGSPKNKQNLNKIINNVTEASEDAKQTIREFKKLAAAGTKTMETADAKIEELAVSLVHTSDEIGRAAVNLRQVLEKINEGEGSAAKIVNDGRLYENLLENSQQLQLLLEELKLFVVKASDKGLPIKLK
jgi:phospholipid/cholesterol/gamma-HCH transport system substrate-binding protein